MPVYIANGSCIISGITIIYQWIIHNYMVAPPDAAASGAVPIRLKISHPVFIFSCHHHSRICPSLVLNMFPVFIPAWPFPEAAPENSS